MAVTDHQSQITNHKWIEAMSKLQTPIRRNDQVVVTTGKDSGKRGRVLKVLPTKNRVIVEGLIKAKAGDVVEVETREPKAALASAPEGTKGP